MTDRPEVIETASRALQRAETIQDHEQRAKLLGRTFRALDDFLADDPESPHREFVENTKSAYLARHLKTLCAVRAPDWLTWMHNVALLGTSQKDVARVLAKHPDLEDFYQRFMAACPESVLERFRAHLARTQTQQ